MEGRFSSRARVGVLSLILLCLAIDNLFPAAEAIWLTLPPSGTKCVSEEIQNHVVVLADYYVIDEHQPENQPRVSVRVTSPFGNNVYHNDNVTHGQFALTTSEAGNYLACFWVDPHSDKKTPVTLGLDWKIGIAAKDWDSVAKKEKIEGVELHLRRLEGHVQAIHDNLIFLKSREAEMRQVSEETNSRVAWLSIVSISVCISASVLQIWRLKRFFEKKKLI